MKRGIIAFVILLLVPVAVAQLPVFHSLAQVSADGGVTSVDPDGDGVINRSHVETDFNRSGGIIWTLFNTGIGDIPNSDIELLVSSNNSEAGNSDVSLETKLNRWNLASINDTGYFELQDSAPTGPPLRIASGSSENSIFINSSRVGIGAQPENSRLYVDGDINTTGTFYGDGSGLENVGGSRVIIASGKVAHGAQIPLPEGISDESKCEWVLSDAYHGKPEAYRTGTACYASTGVVTPSGGGSCEASLVYPFNVGRGRWVSCFSCNGAWSSYVNFGHTQYLIICDANR